MASWRVPVIASVSITLLGLVCGCGQQNRNQRVGPLSAEDYIEIQQLYARYTRTIQMGEPYAEEWAATFTADGAHGRRVGRAALVQLARDYHAKSNGANLRHFVGSLVIEGTALGATGSCNSLVVDISLTPPAVVRAAVYSDVLVRTSEGWRFKTRTERTDSMIAPVP
jgi:hypothetical protein